jgi:hypothetical protein
MMKFLQGCWVACLLLLLPFSAFGVSGWTDAATVVELTPTIHKRFHVRLNVSENPSGCKDKEMFYQDYLTTGAQFMFRTLLEAVASGKQVQVHVTGNCELNGYAEISAVTILP